MLTRTFGRFPKLLTLEYVIKDSFARSSKSISTACSLCMPYEPPVGPRGWPRYNKIVYPPQDIDDPPRPAVSL